MSQGQNRTGVYSKRTITLLELSARPEGVGESDLADGEPVQALYRLQTRGLIFTLKKGTRAFKRRYFDTQARADAYYQANPQPKKSEKLKKPKKAKPIVLPKSSGAIKGPQGPARMDGPCIITEHTRITIAPPPPAVLYRSNTHSNWG